LDFYTSVCLYGLLSSFLDYLFSGITIQHPFDWDLISDIPFFDFAFLFDESAALGVKMVDIPSSIDLDQIYASTYAILPFIIPEYQLITAGETSFSGYPAYGISFEKSTTEKIIVRNKKYECKY
jgi:hypothetical protein